MIASPMSITGSALMFTSFLDSHIVTIFSRMLVIVSASFFEDPKKSFCFTKHRTRFCIPSQASNVFHRSWEGTLFGANIHCSTQANPYIPFVAARLFLSFDVCRLTLYSSQLAAGVVPDSYTQISNSSPCLLLLYVSFNDLQYFP